MRKQPLAYLLCSAVAATCWVALLGTSHMMPMTWDEGNAFLRAERLAEWFDRLKEGEGVVHALSKEGLREGWPYTVEIEGHPALYGIVIAAGRASGGAWLPPLSAARLGPITLFSLAVGAVALRLWRQYSPAAALAGAAAIMTMPRVFGHAHTINGDAVLMSCWMLAWAAFPPALASARMSVVWGILLGLTMSTRFSGWLAILPFAAWSSLYGDRGAVRALATGLPVALVTFIGLNPRLWHNPCAGLITFFDMNLHRTLNVGTQFLGTWYDLTHPLPWYSSLYWLAATVPTGTLLLGAVGAGSALRGWIRDGRGPLLVLNCCTLLAVRALPGAPPHDAERLILSSFPFFGALAGVGCHSILAWARAGQSVRWRTTGSTVLVASLLAGSASSVAWYAPQWLSYYSLAAGGLRGAAAAGMEPTYYWDSLDSEVLDWLHEHTAPGEKIKFSPMSGENLTLLHRWGVLRHDTEENDPGHYRWYVLQRRPSFMSAADRHLDDHETPVFTETIRPPDAGWGPWRLDVPLLKVFTYEQFERARDAGKHGP